MTGNAQCNKRHGADPHRTNTMLIQQMELPGVY